MGPPFVPVPARKKSREKSSWKGCGRFPSPLAIPTRSSSAAIGTRTALPRWGPGSRLIPRSPRAPTSSSPDLSKGAWFRFTSGSVAWAARTSSGDFRMRRGCGYRAKWATLSWPHHGADGRRGLRGDGHPGLDGRPGGSGGAGVLRDGSIRRSQTVGGEGRSARRPWPGQVRTRAIRTTAAPRNRKLGSHAAQNGGSPPEAPIAPQTRRSTM